MDNRDEKIEQWSELLRKIRHIKFAMMTTEGEGRTLHSRPMATLEAAESGAFWFFTGRSSLKVREIENDTRVNLAYVSSDNETFVSVAGEAQVIEDGAKAKALWNPLMKAWFPDGLDDPELVLIRVDVDEAEYWDTSSKKMVTLIRFAKSLIGGEASEIPTGHGTIRPAHDI
ncbi:MAG: pyridoxamine 5'-phosphate oxidase family protein [Fibrobacteria bacterium]